MKFRDQIELGIILFVILGSACVASCQSYPPQSSTSRPQCIPSYSDSSQGLPTIGQWPFATRVGDVNNDGCLDIIRLRGHDDFNPSDQGFQIWLGDGTGIWTKTTIPNGNFGYGGTAIGDFNNDGDLDAAYGVHHNGNHPLIGAWAGDGGTSFSEHSTGLATDGEDWAMAPCDFGDFDNDGFLDLGVGSMGGTNGIRAYLNHDGGGYWSSESNGLPHNDVNPNVGNFILWADMNKDGNLDIVIATQIVSTGQEHFIWLGDGEGNWAANDFGLPVEYDYGSYGLDVGDVNNDGWLDITFIKNNGPVVYLFDGSGWREASFGLPVGGYYCPLAFGDLNNDGFLDLVGLSGFITGTYPNYLEWTTVHAWLGDGTGNWTEIGGLATDIPGWPQSVILADIDHNNFLDIILSSDRGDNEPGCIKVYKETTAVSQISVVVREPTGSEVFIPGGIRFIRWSSGYWSGSSTASLAYSCTGPQGPWLPIVENITNTHVFQWTVPNVYSTNVFIQVTVYANGQSSTAVSPRPITILGDNAPPDPPLITGPTSGIPQEAYEFFVQISDYDSDDLMVNVSWGDGTATNWFGPFASGETINVSHSWGKSGEYIILAKARDNSGLEGAWSLPHLMSIGKVFVNLSLHGGFGATLFVNNIGESPLENSSWKIHIRPAGKLGLVFNSEFNSTSPLMIPPDTSESIRVIPVGLSKINISAEVFDSEGLILATLQKNGWLLGVFVFLK